MDDSSNEHWDRDRMIAEGEKTTGLLPVHAPLRHVSIWVQALPSSHDVPSASGGWMHAPLAGSHRDAWQAAGAGQTTGAPPTQAPAWQTSVCVHALPSSQALPSSFGCTVQAPLAGSHTPT